MTDKITTAANDAELSLTEVLATDPDVDMGRITGLGYTLESAAKTILVRRRTRRALEAARAARREREAAA